ncbi:MAG: DUF3237 domain-containing protein [Clostridiales bacterium]|nr:DUF3237 domain-containing protein [Clostridiales bacterium]
MEPLFTIEVDLHECHTLRSAKGQVNMICFGGRCDCAFFHGEILSGGVDTQTYLTGEPGRLSARYMLSGTDDAGMPARLFIENNGETGADGVCVTHPRIFTDNPRLAWLEDTPLTGRIQGREGGVTILFFEED